MLLLFRRALHGHRHHYQSDWVVWVFDLQCSLPPHVTSLWLLLLVVSFPSSCPKLLLILLPSPLSFSMMPWSDGKRPDGLTLVPWERGRPMIWDVTVPDTMAPSYQSAAVSQSGSVAAQAEAKKSSKYNHFSFSYSFPIAH